MTSEQYIKSCWDKAYNYINGVDSKTIIAGEDAELLIKLLKSQIELCSTEDYDWSYSTKKVERVFSFFSDLLISKSEDNPQLIQFPLTGWQCLIIMFLYGFYHRKTKELKYQTMFLLIGRKNGKSTFAFALQLYSLVLSEAIDPQCLFIAQDGESAGQLLNIAKRIVYNTDPLNEELEVFSRTIKFKKSSQNLGYLKIKVHKADVLHGSSPSCAILDEVHTYRDDTIYNALTSGLGGRKNPLIILATSGGNKKAIFCHEKIKYSRAILKGKIVNERFLPVLFTLDEGDNYEDESLWIKSNPSMVDFPYLKYFLPKEFNEKKHSETGLREFMTLNLNLFLDEKTVWLTERQIDSLFYDKDGKPYSINMEDLRGCKAWLGMDLSAVYDLTAIVVIVKHPKTDKFIIIPYLFMPNNPTIFQRRDGVNLGKWAEQNHIIYSTAVSSGKIVLSPDEILKKLKEIKEFFQIQELCYDSKLSYMLISQINKDLGIKNTQPFDHKRENYDRLLDDFEYLMNKEQIIIQNNPVVKWQFMNAKLDYDNRFLRKISRKSSEESIDSTVALLYALQGYFYWAMPQYNKKIV
jgi:phage terminase large subunit-like protein